jgi:hypothetical protein
VEARWPVAKGKAAATAPDAADAVETSGGRGRRRRRGGGRWWRDLDDGLRRRGSAWSSCIPTCRRRRAGSRLSWLQGCDIMCDIILFVISCVISYVISHMRCHRWCHMDTCDITLWYHIWYHGVMCKNECDITHDVFLGSLWFHMWYHRFWTMISHNCDITVWHHTWHHLWCTATSHDIYLWHHMWYHG